MTAEVAVYAGEALARYAFGQAHPFGPYRHAAFLSEFERRGYARQVSLREPAAAERADIELFHTRDYVERVMRQSALGRGFLDWGDTPAFPGVYEAAATGAGTTLAALEDIMTGRCRRAFVPIAGLHHARRGEAAGFCVFNDCGIAVEALRRRYGICRVAYVDIDAHHGDGVYYAYEDDPDLIFADIHEDGRHLYPGSGGREERGKGAALGTKLNVPMPAGAGDRDFMSAWEGVEAFIDAARPEFILFQCGADSLDGDPITHLAYTAAVHAHAARRLCALADRHGSGRLLGLGGGGYDPGNIAQAWNAVVAQFISASAARPGPGSQSSVAMEERQ
ncbi:MAG: acetoin utilization protein AcuC [Gammaproteobacteria bacterium]|nr:acetoin utilization protein AcuC [Gammaproteobacteria bacterium]